MKLNYRPEIDGLRAIAIISVILYHTQFTISGHQPFKGGFLGVDIFFVISGYLITSIILKELINTGSFSFKNFYKRRIRRILPALILVILASLPIAWLYLLPVSITDLVKSVLYSLFFSSNYYFHYSGQEYGATSGLLKPFLHTWSLSVEEQFYIFFPIVLFFIFKHFKKFILHSFLFFFLISLGFSEWTSKIYPSASFYFIHTRIWEFLAGSILAYTEIKQGYRSKNRLFNEIFSFLGLVLIVLYIIFFKNYFSHPSFYTLPVIVSTCLILWFLEKENFAYKILSSKFFVGIGLISYSLYLWHYPIFAFVRITEFINDEWYKIFIIAIITLILSVVSYNFIEKPARNKDYKFIYVVLNIAAFYLLIVFFSLIVIFNSGFKDRVENDFFLLENLDARNTNKKIYDKCHRNFNSENNEFCKFGQFNAGRDIYLVGDSHAGVLIFELVKKINAIGKNVFTLTGGGKILKTTNFDAREKSYQEKRLKRLGKLENSIVVISGFYTSNNFNYNLEKDGYRKLFKELIKNNNHIIILKPNPTFDNPLWNNGKNFIGKKINQEKLKISKDDYLSSIEKFDKFIREIKIDELNIVDVSEIFCDERWCYVIRENNIMLVDNNHPSLYAVGKIINLVLDKIKPIVKGH
jgi:peptidoglycan/LPS O-acetylase OafA/YrhL